MKDIFTGHVKNSERHKYFNKDNTDFSETSAIAKLLNDTFFKKNIFDDLTEICTKYFDDILSKITQKDSNFRTNYIKFVLVPEGIIYYLMQDRGIRYNTANDMYLKPQKNNPSHESQSQEDQPKRKRGRPARTKNSKETEIEKPLSQDVTKTSSVIDVDKAIEGDNDVQPKISEHVHIETEADLLLPVQINLQRLSPRHLKLAQMSPVRILTESPLVLMPSPKPNRAKKVISFNVDGKKDKEDKVEIKAEVKDDTEDLIESSQDPEENITKRRSRRSISRMTSKNNETSTKSDDTENSSNNKLDELKGKRSKVNKFGESPLHLAAKHGKFDRVKELIEEGANINAKDNAGWTPLHEAAQYSGVRGQEVLEYLVAKGADVNARYSFKLFNSYVRSLSIF